jgi:competence protein ComGC
MAVGNDDGWSCGGGVMLSSVPELIRESEVVTDESVDAERRIIRERATAEEEKDERVLRVEELGVDGLIRDGTFIGRGGDDDRW